MADRWTDPKWIALVDKAHRAEGAYLRADARNAQRELNLAKARLEWHRRARALELARRAVFNRQQTHQQHRIADGRLAEAERVFQTASDRLMAMFQEPRPDVIPLLRASNEAQAAARLGPRGSDDGADDSASEVAP